MRRDSGIYSLARRRDRGLGLVELALALAIGALLVAGAVLYFANASAAHKTNEAMSQLTAIQQVVRGLYSGQPDYTGLTSNIVALSKHLLSKFIKGTGAAAAITSPFNAALTVLPTSRTAGIGVTHFTVNLVGVPDQACTKMATTDFVTVLACVSVTGAISANTSGAPLPPQVANMVRENNDSTMAWTFN